MVPVILKPLDVRIPKWDIGRLNPRNCPFCKTANNTVLKRPDQLPVAFCNTCGCCYLNSLPHLSDIIKLYDGYYHTHRPTDLSEKAVLRMIENARKASKTNWQLQTLLKLNTGSGQMRILDVGCGFGRFLLAARSTGANVIGCDLSPEACKFANRKLDITVHQSELHLCSSSIDSVDAVVMNDFIEHPANPLIEIQAAISILKPGGLLFIHTPNGGEAGTTIETAIKWVGFRVDLEHLQYLSPHTVNWLSQKYGLRIERLETSGFPGLSGIDTQRKPGASSTTREIAKKIPGISKLAKILRIVKTEITGGKRDLRLGSYHLFTILRKL